MAACAAPPVAPVVERSMVSDRQVVEYVVSRGDTLYSIAWRFDRDYVELARLNGIPPPYVLLPGQRLALRGEPPPRASDPPARRPVSSTSPASTPPVAAWRWPASGRVVRDFGGGSNGVNFELARNAEVVAAAAGDVVYAGGGLRGYRRLVIIKHDRHYLSAYSLNHEVGVAEGQRVAAGGLLARVGEPTEVHFEIRLDGEPVNPRGVIDR